MWCWVLSVKKQTPYLRWRCRLNVPCGAGCFLTWAMGILATTELGLNAPSGDGCFLVSKMKSNKKYDYSINAPSGAGCFLTPASGNGVVAPLPGGGAPPAPQAPRGAGRQRPNLTTFRRPDAKRTDGTLSTFSHQLPTTSSQKADVPACDCGYILMVGAESGPELDVKGASSVESPGCSTR